MKKKLLIHQLGFSLIEMLVVVSVFGVVIATATGLMFTVIKNNKKARQILNMKQQGENVVQVFHRTATQAENIVGACNQNVTTITFFTAAAQNHQFQCQAQTVNSIVGGVTTALIDPTQNYTLTNCLFSCYNSSITTNISVDFSFTLSDASTGENINFSTGASLRNLQ